MRDWPSNALIARGTLDCDSERRVAVTVISSRSALERSDTAAGAAPLTAACACAFAAAINPARATPVLAQNAALDDLRDEACVPRLNEFLAIAFPLLKLI